MDALRDQRGVPWLDDLTRDAHHGGRMLRRTPVFTAVALLTLALGIGANTAIFSIVNGVILRPLDYPKPEQLMYLATEFPALGLTGSPLSVQEYLEFRQINQSFAMVGAYAECREIRERPRHQRKDLRLSGRRSRTLPEQCKWLSWRYWRCRRDNPRPPA